MNCIYNFSTLLRCSGIMAVFVFNHKFLRIQFTSDLLTAVILLLLILSGDVHPNPGPSINHKCCHLNICHSNIRSLSRAKLLAIQTTLKNAFDIITLSETHLMPNVSNDVFKLQGYHDIIRKDRGALGGGVAIYVKENLYYKRLYEYERDNIEAIWIQINSKQGKFLICSVYRPPTNNEFWEHFSSVIDDIKQIHTSNIVIIGDLNADLNSGQGEKLRNLCLLQNMLFLVEEPTHITTHSATVLDQILTNAPVFIEQVNVSDPISTSDHCTISAKLKFELPKETPYERHIWQYDKADFDGFRKAITETNFDHCFETNCIDTACQRWTDTILTQARNYIPNKVVLIRPNDSPWYTTELRLQKRKLNRLFKKFKKRNSIQNWEKYKAARSNYQEQLSLAENEYKKSLHSSLGTAKHVKKWWRVVKDILGKGNDMSYPTLVDGNNYNQENEEKANFINNFFLFHSNFDTSNAVLPLEILAQNEGISLIKATEDDGQDLI